MSVNHFSTGDKARAQRGYEIFKNDGVKEGFKSWKVTSQSKRISYFVDLELTRCGCEDFKNRNIKCKHLYAVEYHLKALQPPEKVVSLKKQTYPQDWKKYNAAQTSEKAAFQYLLAELCKTIVEPPQEVVQNV